MTTFDDRRLWPGTRPPSLGSPDRRPGSVRRTSTVDLIRPEGATGPLVVTGAGRDLATRSDGSAEVVAAATTEVVIDYAGGRTLRTARTDPAVPGIEALVGARVGSGFRRTLAEALPDLAASRGLVHLLLDELTPGTLISGSTLVRSGELDLLSASAAAGPAGGLQSPVDICAGWAAGGAMLDNISRTGIPLLGWGPPAPSLERGDDPLAWHATEPLPPGSMRRRRLLDVGPPVATDGALDTAAAPAVVAVLVRFRDTYGERDGTETVVHEYDLSAEVDADTWTIVAAEARPGPLPAPECPSAAASADRLVGRQVGDLRQVVRDEFVGVSTCTHLNDVFRSLTDVAHLWSLLPVA